MNELKACHRIEAVCGNLSLSGCLGLERSRLGQPSNTYDILGGLFGAMNRSGIASAGLYKGVDYFNGGLFREVNPIELTVKELELLEAAACQDWKAVRPSIFGNIFESAIGKSNSKERHAHGIHFTSEEDILKIVRPTITRFWEEKIEGASVLADLYDLQAEMRNYKVLDPACGSGHFLVIAFDLLARMHEEEARHLGVTRSRAEIAEEIVAKNLFGIDIDGRAIQIAAAALWLKAKLYAPDAQLSALNLVAPALRLGRLPESDPALERLRSDLESEVGIPQELTTKLVKALAEVDYLGSLLRVDRAIEEALREAEGDYEKKKGWQGALFTGFAKEPVAGEIEVARSQVVDKLEAFLAQVGQTFYFQKSLHWIGVGNGQGKMRQVRVVVGHRKSTPGQQVQFLSRRYLEPGANGFQIVRHRNRFQADDVAVKFRADFDVFHGQGHVVVAGHFDLRGQVLHQA